MFPGAPGIVADPADLPMSNLTSASLTHPGMRREGNEDAMCVRPDLGLYAVADGMGGHAAGEVASKIAVEVIEAFVNDTRDADVNRTWPFPYDTALTLNGNRLKAAIRLANRKLAGAMQADDSLRGMATTAVVLLMAKGTPLVAHVGDSRLYCFHDGKLHRSRRITPGSASRCGPACSAMRTRGAIRGATS